MIFTRTRARWKKAEPANPADELQQWEDDGGLVYPDPRTWTERAKSRKRQAGLTELRGTVIFNHGETDMGDKGSKDKGKREEQKKAQLSNGRLAFLMGSARTRGGE